MQRYKRPYAIDIEICSNCGGTLRVTACIEEPASIARILGHVQQCEGRLMDIRPLSQSPGSGEPGLFLRKVSITVRRLAN
jgi:hypothetical protein